MTTPTNTIMGTGMGTRGAARAFALAATVALLAGAAAPLGAQDAPTRTPDVGTILRLRERLELSEEQVARLNELRRQEVARRAEFQRELAELRSRLRAGEIRRSELMAFLEEHREAARDARRGLRERMDAVLSGAQKERLSELRRQRRGVRAGRAMAMRRGAARLRGGCGPTWRKGLPGPARPGRGRCGLG